MFTVSLDPVSFSNSSLQYMQGSLGRSYMCNVEEVLPVVSSLSLHTFDLQVQPFGVHGNQFGPGTLGLRTALFNLMRVTFRSCVQSLVCV